MVCSSARSRKLPATLRCCVSERVFALPFISATCTVNYILRYMHYIVHCMVHYMVHYMVHCIVHYMVHCMVYYL